MKFPNRLKSPLLDIVDSVQALVPRPTPTSLRLQQTKIIAHRGCFENQSGAKENTLAAFRAARQAGAWGIEFDVRWTKDGVPVIHHDESAQRVFGENVKIKDLGFDECRERLHEIPTLEEVIVEFGAGGTHLMIEIKDPLTSRPHRAQDLKKLLAKLEPIRNYHLMSLRLDTLFDLKFAPAKALLPIAEFNVVEMGRAALKHAFGGLTSQYMLLTQNAIERHHRVGQRVGTGFAASRSVLFREINRGIDWIFTNHAPEMARICEGK